MTPEEKVKKESLLKFYISQSEVEERNDLELIHLILRKMVSNKEKKI